MSSVDLKSLEVVEVDDANNYSIVDIDTLDFLVGSDHFDDQCI